MLALAAVLAVAIAGSLAGNGTVKDSSATAATLTTGGNGTSTTFSGDIIDDGVLGLTGLRDGIAHGHHQAMRGLTRVHTSYAFA